MTHADLPEVKAVASTADLLAAIESFEAVGCDLNGITQAYIRAMKGRGDMQSFTWHNVAFDVRTLPAAVLVLAQVLRPAEDGRPTLRPFAELLVERGITNVRLCGSGSAFDVFLQTSRDFGQTWKRLPISQEAKAS